MIKTSLWLQCYIASSYTIIATLFCCKLKQNYPVKKKAICWVNLFIVRIICTPCINIQNKMQAPVIQQSNKIL